MAPSTEDPLSQYTKLSPSIYIQEPTANNATTSPYPKTIILSFWMNAPPRALSKYVQEYTHLAPQARIIIILSSSSDFILRFTEKAQQTRLAPAVIAIQASSKDPVFIHMFSNGGVFTTINLLEAYQKTTGQSLRISATVLDSAPGTATVSGALKAFSYVLPRLWVLRVLSRFLLWVFLSVGAVFRRVVGVEDAVSVARKKINDSGLLVCEGELKRCYVYSEGDDLVQWGDVERHADEAEGKGWVVRREKFEGSGHVAHMRADPERYWGIVRSYLD
ncbi:hypothetical protein BDV29DRAFT_201471 [Aspergillus leporis]|jgi:hypothetical protein|uniref:Indole-diterpene biosynthesis protein PaxU n=1 Tax=Aspergillus leporis TaxID=41062 RepID=A0A5N5X2I3_9EURO|nr:hypothetical protein BDV29DRAFT_201471 [Aspergillus leporis]